MLYWEVTLQGMELQEKKEVSINSRYKAIWIVLTLTFSMTNGIRQWKILKYNESIIKICCFGQTTKQPLTNSFLMYPFYTSRFSYVFRG